VTTRLGFDAKVEPLRIGLYPTEPSIETRATHFSLVAQVGPELPRATVAGTAWLDDGAWLVETHVGCDRLRAGALAAYLPPGVAVEMENGNARFDASIGSGQVLVLGQLANGELGTWSAGRSADVALRDFALTEGDATLAKFDKVELKSAIDLAAGSFEVEALDVSGAELTARRTSDGTLHAAGIALSAAPTSSTPVEATPEPTVATPSAGPTRLALTKGNLELARLEFVDESSGANAEPIVLSARAKIADLVLAGAKASAPPMRVDVEGAAAPFCDRWSTSFVFAEADGEPELDTHFALDGLHGDALTRAWPKLAAQLDGSGLANGTVRASAKMRFRATRRPDRAPDLTQPFGAEIEIGPLELRATPDGEVLAGLEGGRVEIAKIDPKSGDVAIRSIELVKPRGRVRRDAEGVHALGLTLRVPPTAITEAPPSEAPAPELVTQIAAPTTSASELTIDRLSISGLDFELVDATGTPPATVPLVDLDFELRRFSTRALTEPKAFYFNAFVTAGKVDVPRRVESDSLLEGVVDAVGGVLEGEGDEQVTLEQRPLFEEVALAGRITLFPEVRGWVNVGVSSLELSNFRGLAESTGLTLGDGLLDESVRARLQGAQGVSIASRSTFSYLALSEPSGGPISRYLTLPAPLDTVLFLMKDAEDQHKLSVDVRVGADGLSTSELVSAAIGAVTQVIARAVASAPLRLLGAVGGLFGGDEAVAPTDDTLALEYPAGVATLGEREEEQLERLIQRFGDDDRFVFAVQQSLSKADLARAAALANPSADDCRELSARLRRNKSELVRRREELAARARVDYAIGRERESADATLALRGLDRELGSNEDALDRVHELLRPGAERRRDQRTKAALLQVAIERVARLKARLVERGVAADRMEIRSIRATIDAELATGRIVLTPHKRS
ncbi:MAG: hypothetical protein K8S98_06875, partial [Planctomycetes bacterium]|nr:hypothetical protein [Planctomycetota bacterium]